MSRNQHGGRAPRRARSPSPHETVPSPPRKQQRRPAQAPQLRRSNGAHSQPTVTLNGNGNSPQNSHPTVTMDDAGATLPAQPRKPARKRSQDLEERLDSQFTLGDDVSPGATVTVVGDRLVSAKPTRDDEGTVQHNRLDSRIRKAQAQTKLLDSNFDDDIPIIDRGRSNYIREYVLGQGGMGIVYAARQKDLDGAWCAIKEILPDKLTPDALQKFKREKRIMGQIRDLPNVVGAFGIEKYTDGSIALAIPLIKGDAFSKLIHADEQWARKKLKEARENNDPKELIYERLITFARKNPKARQQRLIELMVPIFNAVANIHDAGIVHRDLKPDNIFMGPNEDAYVGDYGLAKIIGETDDLGTDNATTDPFLTRDGAVQGTPYYMPPEQAKGVNKDTNPSDFSWDQYALGAMLYEIITGVPPGYDPEASVFEVLDKRRKGQVQPPSTLKKTITAKLKTAIRKGIRKDDSKKRLREIEQLPAVDPQLEAIIMKMMHNDPRRRYSSVKEARKDLDRYLKKEDVHAYNYSPWEKANRWVGRNTTKAITTVVGVVALGAAVTGFSLYAQGMQAAEMREQQAEMQQQQAAAQEREAEIREEAAAEAERQSEISSLLMEAVSKYNFKDHSAAERIYLSLINDYDYKTTEVYSGLAKVNHSGGQYDEAVSFADRAIELDSTNAQGWYARGLANAALANFGAAVSDYEEAIDRGLPYVYLNLGRLHAHLGRDEEALESYARYYETNIPVDRHDAESEIRRLCQELDRNPEDYLAN